MPKSIVDPETGEVYVKPLRFKDTPLPDIAMLVVLMLGLTFIGYYHLQNLSLAWPSPLALPYIQHAQFLVGAEGGEALAVQGIFPLYPYFISLCMVLKNSPLFQDISLILFGVNLFAYVGSMSLFYMLASKMLPTIAAFLLTVLVALSPLTINSVTALGPEPLFWLFTLILLFTVPALSQQKKVAPLIMGSIMAALLGLLHPLGIAVVLAWGLCLITLGAVAPILIGGLSFAIILVTVPGFSVFEEAFQAYTSSSQPTDAFTTTSLFAPLQDRIHGLFLSIYEMGKTLLLSNNINLEGWPIQTVKETWFSQLMASIYITLGNVSFIIWPVGFAFAIMVIAKALQTLFVQREALPSLFLSWVFVLVLAMAFVMPKMFLVQSVTVDVLLPLAVLTAFSLVTLYGKLPGLNLILPPIRKGIIIVASVCALLFQARVGYNVLANVYAPEEIDRVDVAPNNRITPERSEAFNFLAYSATSKEQSVSHTPTQSLSNWVIRNTTARTCFHSMNPIKDSLTLARPSVNTPRAGGAAGFLNLLGSDLQQPLTCPYFVEHKDNRDTYNWVRSEVDATGATVVYNDARVDGIRIWRLASIPL